MSVTFALPLARPFDQPEFARCLFEESGDAMFLVDPESDRVLEANRTALALTGFSFHEIADTDATMLFRLERAAPVQSSSQLRTVSMKTTVFHGRDGYLLRTKSDPGWVPVTLTVTRLHLQPQTLALFTARNDSERREALHALRKNEERFRALVEQSTEGIAIIDPQAIIRYVSPSHHGVFGYSTSELQNQPFLKFIHPDDHARAIGRFEDCLKNPGVPIENCVRLRDASGNYRYVETVGVNRLADASVGGVVINYRDSTQRILRDQRLAEQNNLLTTLFNSTPDFICVKDR
ncbi:MAG: PAS domain-containing protein, partial [Gemmataceae bacterium]